MQTRFFLFVIAVALFLSTGALGGEVRDYARIKGEGESVLRGLGLVIGLNGTGDNGSEVAMARPLAELLGRNGNPIATIEELANTRSVALVMVTATIPRSGAKIDDTFDASVNVINSASSLRGGELFLAPLLGPLEHDPVFAIAAGSIQIEDPEIPTRATVRGGARMVRDIDTTPPVAGSFDLVVDTVYSGWGAVSHIAAQINDTYFLTTDPLSDPIARVLDNRTIRITVPEVERPNPSTFVADVLGTDVIPSQLGLPAMIVANTRTGSVAVTGDVQISPALITHGDLVITTTLPAPQPTAEQPLIERSRWTGVETNAQQTELARIGDLLSTLGSLDVPPRDQISILLTLHKAGKLHAKLIIDGVEQ